MTGSRSSPAPLRQPVLPALPALLCEVLDALLDGHGLYRPEPGEGPPQRLLGVHMNPVGLALRGLTLEQFIGSDVLTRTQDQGNDEAAAAYAAVISTGEPLRRRLVTDRMSGRERTYELNGVRVRGHALGVQWLLSLSFRDVTDEIAARRRLQEQTGQLAQLAQTDALTGLLNRRGWEAALARLLDRATVTGEDLLVVILDLDHFKDFNDARGHAAGDDLLQGLGRAWLEGLPRLAPGAELARLGGEEFGLLLPASALPLAARAAPLEAARGVADTLRGLVREGQTASAGITAWVHGEPQRALLARADAALYAAKRAGRDRVEALRAG